MNVLTTWKQWARKLKVNTYALYLAYKDPRTPWYAKVWSGFVVAYAFSPIDLIPDFIPIVGYLDDLILVPIGIAVAMRLIPQTVLTECQEKAAARLDQGKIVNWGGALVIIAIWVICALAVIALIVRAVRGS